MNNSYFFRKNLGLKAAYVLVNLCLVLTFSGCNYNNNKSGSKDSTNAISYQVAFIEELFDNECLLGIMPMQFIIISKGNYINERNSVSGELTIFHAGSFSMPAKEIIAAFNKAYPNINIKTEAAGSVECARKITELKKPCDIIISADYKVIDKLLIPDYADWNIKFATNELCIVFTDKSKYADQINQSNWFDLLLKKDVFFGRSDPNSDPCGYRSVLSIQLAEKYYNKKGLETQLLKKDNNFIRPKETDLLALLETNAVDYIFLYRSVAEQHKLKYLILPDSINLKTPELADYYKTATIEINGKKPGEKITQVGEPMVYGIAILKNAPNYKAAITFVDFLLDKEKGMKIIEKNGQPSVIPGKTESYDKIPQELKKYAVK